MCSFYWFPSSSFLKRAVLLKKDFLPRERVFPSWEQILSSKSRPLFDETGRNFDKVDYPNVYPLALIWTQLYKSLYSNRENNIVTMHHNRTAKPLFRICPIKCACRVIHRTKISISLSEASSELIIVCKNG